MSLFYVLNPILTYLQLILDLQSVCPMYQGSSHRACDRLTRLFVYDY